MNNTNIIRSNSSPLADMMSSHVAPSINLNTTTNSNDNTTHQSESSIIQEIRAVGMVPPRPASTGLISSHHYQYNNKRQQKQKQQNCVEKISSSSSVMGSLGLIQFDDIRGGRSSVVSSSDVDSAGGGVIKHKSVMNWLQEDFPKTSSPEYPNVSLSTNPNAADQVDGNDKGRDIMNDKRYSPYDEQHYESSSMPFEANEKNVNPPYGVHDNPYKPPTLHHVSLSKFVSI